MPGLKSYRRLTFDTHRMNSFVCNVGVNTEKESRSYMNHHTITGGGGIQLHVVETGNPKGRPILFIHGFSQSWLAWSRQLSSDLAQDFRLVAMDNRGHGLSDKPREGYDDSKLWADDVNAVVQGLGLNGAIFSCWSYGSLVILDYLRHYGQASVGGIQVVGSINRLGSDEALSVLTPDFLSLVPGFFSNDVEESVSSLKSLVRMCLVQEPEAADLYLMLGYNLSVPPYVRQGLFSRAFDNDDILPTIQKPILITHGAEDAIVRPAVVEKHWPLVRHAQTQMIPNSGHAPFWEAAQAFNQRLRSFAQSV